eukprot:s1918_g2.t1
MRDTRSSEKATETAQDRVSVVAVSDTCAGGMSAALHKRLLLLDLTSQRSLTHRPTDLALNAAVAAGQRGQAWRICLELVRGSTTRPDTVALNAAASALASGARWREGLLMAAEVAETTVVTLGASVRAGDLGSAWRLAVGVVRSASVSVLQIGQVIYGSVASACEPGPPRFRNNNGRKALAMTCMEKAQQLLTELMQRALRQNSVLGNTVAAAAAAVSRASAWQRLLLSVDASGPQATYQLIGFRRWVVLAKG